MRLAILLALALAVAPVQCAVSCVEDDCGAKSQPCHHHDSSKQVKCAHEIPAAKAPAIVSAAMVPVVAGFVNFATISSNRSRLGTHGATPPPPLLTLRM